MGILEDYEEGMQISNTQKALLFLYAGTTPLSRDQQYKIFGLIAGLSREDVEDAFEIAIANGWASITPEAE